MFLQLQEKKSAMVNATLSADDQAMGRLTPEDVSFSYSFPRIGMTDPFQLGFLFRVRISIALSDLG